MTQEQADMRREELAKVIVTKQDERIRELELAVRVMGDRIHVLHLAFACYLLQQEPPERCFDRITITNKALESNTIAWDAVCGSDDSWCKDPSAQPKAAS